jgi:hypothetical protein
MPHVQLDTALVNQELLLDSGVKLKLTAGCVGPDTAGNRRRTSVWHSEVLRRRFLFVLGAYRSKILRRRTSERHNRVLRCLPAVS